MYQNFILWLNNIPFYVKPHFVYAFICWYLGSFLFVATLNNASVNTDKHLFVSILNPFGYIWYLEVQLLGHMVIQFSFLRNNTIMVL